MSYDTLKAKVELLIEKAKSGGVQYTDIVYNDDNTVTLTDTSGVEHTISCVYENNRLLSMTYDGKEVVTVYDNGELVSVGETEVDVANAPLDNTLENLIDKSEVLGTTDETVTVTEKVEQLIDKAENENKWYEHISANMSKMTKLFQKYSYSQLPRVDFSNATNISFFFTSALITSIDYYLNTNNVHAAQDAFSHTKNLKRMKGLNTSSLTNPHAMFYNSAIETIEEPLDFSKVTQTGNTFSCKNLKDIKFVAESIKISIAFTSAVLSAESIQSIIDGLATLAEGATAQTLTLSKNLPLTEEQKQAITTAVNNKGWTLAFA